MAKQLRQARAVARAASNWVRHDLREILFPSSIPNPPGIEEEHEQQRAKRDWPKVCAHVGRVPPRAAAACRCLTAASAALSCAAAAPLYAVLQQAL